MPTKNYDSWKLASPSDDYPEVKAGECSYCGIELYAGNTVIQEGATDEYFCNKWCYQAFVKEHIDDYFEVIKEAYEVGEKTIEV